MAEDWVERFVLEGGQASARLGSRFDAGGRFLPERGNTVVAQVVPGSRTEAALITLRARLQALPHGDRFAYTDVSSYHMTVFEGVVETRRAASHWPAGLDPLAEMGATTASMATRLAGFVSPPWFAMRITEVTPFGLHLTGATDADEAAARGWRDALSAALGLRTPGHEAYGFHTTLAYPMYWPPAEAVPAYQQALRDLTAWISAEVPVMDLARPAFCTFADMNAFPPVLAL